MNLVWAAGGFVRGTRIIRAPDGVDGLAVYEAAVPRLAMDAEAVAAWREGYALRFLDPDGRRDRAGRPIVHEVVILDPLAVPDHVPTAVAEVWPEIRDEYAELWDGD